MALCALSDDALGVIYVGLINVLDPGVAVDFSSASKGLWEPTQAMRQQLRADYEVAVALSRKAGLGGCKALRDAKQFTGRGLSAVELTLLGSLGAVLDQLETLSLFPLGHIGAAGPDGVQRLAERLGAGALPAVTELQLIGMHVGDAGASALATALGRGALPRLEWLNLSRTAIGDAGLVALAPALRRLPGLKGLNLFNNPFGDDVLAALVAPLPPAGALWPPTGALTELKALDLRYTQITDAGCAALASALDRGALPALETLLLDHTQASAASKAGVVEALARSRAAVPS